MAEPIGPKVDQNIRNMIAAKMGTASHLLMTILSIFSVVVRTGFAGRVTVSATMVSM